MQEYGWLLWLIALALIFWLLIIRPASKRQKQVAKLQAALTPGDEVVLTSGVYATVTETADTHVMVEIAPGVTIKVARGAVGAVVRDEPPVAEIDQAGDQTDQPSESGEATGEATGEQGER